VKPAPFEYVAPESLEEAIGLLGEHGEVGKILAGGQSLGPLLNMRLASPEVLIDINRLEELSYIRQRDGHLEIGALARQRTVERSSAIPRTWPLISAAMPYVGHLTLRNRGTVCGSLAHADPAAELPAVATALDAELRVLGPEGERTVPATDFFLSYMTTNLEPEELLAEVRFPPPQPRTGHAWLEIARRHGDYALVGVAAVLTLREDGTCASARLVYTGVAPVPFDAQESVELLVGEQPSEDSFAEVAEHAAKASEPGTDVHASAGYRRHLVDVLTRWALGKALKRARGDEDGA
jgi:aerobic carbon-monoxide dehydrogenase medium subunit